MTRRGRWTSGVAIVVATCAVVAAVILLWPKQSHSDCDTVRDIFAYNKQHNELLKSKTNIDAGQEPSVSDYQDWATRLHDFAGQLHDQKLAAQTHHLAESADKSVDAIKRGRADTAAPPVPNPPTPQWVTDYGAADQQFRAGMADLHEACPG
jgi:hypothetical protein